MQAVPFYQGDSVLGLTTVEGGYYIMEWPAITQAVSKR